MMEQLMNVGEFCLQLTDKMLARTFNAVMFTSPMLQWQRAIEKG